MIILPELSWNKSNGFNDMMWLDDALNWDDVAGLVTADYSMVGLLFSSAFLNTHHFLDWLVKLSTLDLLFINEVDSDASVTSLFTALMQDSSTQFSTVLLALPLVYYSDFQDLVTTISHYAPELTLALRDMLLFFWMNVSVGSSPSAAFDVYQDQTHTSLVEFFEYLSLFYYFIVVAFVAVSVIRISSLSTSVDTYIVRAYFYLYSMSTEVRFSLEAALQVFFFTFLYTSMMVMTFDDDQEELLEFFNTMCFYFFLFTLVYYLFKYSLHYFSFLEAAKGDSKSYSPVSQFLFDSLNIIAFVLRFLVLMIRLNIYDGVDDLLDSYYIFMADFEEEEYFSDAFFSMFSVMSFDTDVNDDRSFLFEDEMDFTADFFTLYFIVWGKFAYFWLFFLEEIARVSLALYVTYLLMFEINAVNRSYAEDNYLSSKRSA